MKQRDPLAATLLSLFVPFYILYWFYATAKDLKAKGQKVPSLLLLLAPFLIFLVFFIMIMGAGVLRANTTSGSANVAGAGLSIIIFLSFPVLIALPLVYYYRFGKAVEAATNGTASKGLLFVLFWFVAPAGVFITQEKLNQAGGAPMATPPANNPVGGPVPPAPLPPTPPTYTPPPTNPVI